MFKAIGRWGSQVRSSINLHIFSNIFGSKSKKYGDLDNEEEEIFIDAQEDIDHESDTEEDSSTRHLTELKRESTDLKLDKTDGKSEQANGDINLLETRDVVNEQLTTRVEVVERKETAENVSTEVNESKTEYSSSHKETEKENGSSESSGDDSEAENEDDDDDHHINHKDTKQMVKNTKQNNGIVHSASSSSMIQKVHRRMNSYTQRQYAKFDNTQDDENDNVIHSTEESSQDIVDSHDVVVVDDDIEQAQVIKSEKKSKRKKKIAKRTRKAVRGLVEMVSTVNDGVRIHLQLLHVCRQCSIWFEKVTTASVPFNRNYRTVPPKLHSKAVGFIA